MVFWYSSGGFHENHVQRGRRQGAEGRRKVRNLRHPDQERVRRPGPEQDCALPRRGGVQTGPRGACRQGHPQLGPPAGAVQPAPGDQAGDPGTDPRFEPRDRGLVLPAQRDARLAVRAAGRTPLHQARTSPRGRERRPRAGPQAVPGAVGRRRGPDVDEPDGGPVRPRCLATRPLTGCLHSSRLTARRRCGARPSRVPFVP